ncbi:uncharacterized protein LOC114538508 [Dendronephthya gigantea]|uniref:uncharacterized protein LOC114538508 n=1 Tax=Dendronephthya gigantea TaxID=151771 RepID=UPI00106C7D0A|nr:uncharacterized protein LOC114538508 [Dendronephthya gigantea]
MKTCYLIFCPFCSSYTNFHSILLHLGITLKTNGEGRNSSGLKADRKDCQKHALVGAAIGLHHEDVKMSEEINEQSGNDPTATIHRCQDSLLTDENNEQLGAVLIDDCQDVVMRDENNAQSGTSLRAKLHDHQDVVMTTDENNGQLGANLTEDVLMADNNNEQLGTHIGEDVIMTERRHCIGVPLTHGHADQSAADITDGNCHVCFGTVSGSHICIVCHRSVHVFCGEGIGDEGYGQAVTCYKCLDRGKKQTKYAETESTDTSADENSGQLGANLTEDVLMTDNNNEQLGTHIGEDVIMTERRHCIGVPLTHGHADQSAADITDGNCHVCFGTVSGSHICIVCHRSVHVFCGEGIGDEGYGQAVTCYKCLDRGKKQTKYAETESTDTSDNPHKTAHKRGSRHKEESDEDYLPSSESENEDKDPATYKDEYEFQDTHNRPPIKARKRLKENKNIPKDSSVCDADSMKEIEEHPDNNLKKQKRERKQPFKIWTSKTDASNNENGSKVYVQPIMAAAGKRAYDKKNCCFFCSKEFSKLARHLEQKHKDEEEVAAALKFPPSDKRRKDLFAKLRKMGNFNHNIKVIEKREGELKVDRRPAAGTDPKQYLPCTGCNGFFLAHELTRHAATCLRSDEPAGGKVKPSAKRMQFDGKLLLAGGGASECSKQLQSILKIMARDDISAVAQADPTILAVGSDMVEQKGKEKAIAISQKMRLLARVLVEMRRLTGKSDASLSTIITPLYFDMLLQCAKNLGGYVVDEDGSKSFKSPSTSVKCGYATMTAAKILRGKALRDCDMGRKKELDNFLELYETEWGKKITSPAHDNLGLKKTNKPDVLPLTSDLMKLRDYLLEAIKKGTENLRRDRNKENFRVLSEVCLARLIMFNKRRGGETARMKLKAYQSRCNWREHQNQEVFQSLSVSEKQLCEKFDMVEIIGKRNRKVPVILTPDVADAMLMLTDPSYREKGCVQRENEYVFPMNNNSSLHSLRGNDVLRNACKNANLENDSLVTSTSMRKYVATVSQLVDMNETEMGWLAEHMGHDLHIHKEYYRLPQNTLEIAVVGNLLLAIDEGRAHKFKGRNLRDINIQEFENFACEEDDEAANNLGFTECSSKTKSKLASKTQENTDLPTSSITSRNTPSSCASTSKQGSSKTKERADDKISTVSSPKTPIAKTKKGRAPQKLVKWTTPERRLVMRSFDRHIKNMELPKKKECVQFLAEHQDVMARRNWKNIKDFVRNQEQKMGDRL